VVDGLCIRFTQSVHVSGKSRTRNPVTKAFSGTYRSSHDRMKIPDLLLSNGEKPFDSRKVFGRSRPLSGRTRSSRLNNLRSGVRRGCSFDRLPERSFVKCLMQIVLERVFPVCRVFCLFRNEAVCLSLFIWGVVPFCTLFSLWSGESRWSDLYSGEPF
jgi:hypothetical protein